jgi:glycosyltransferase involved in cell wall biosynthesis
MKFAIVITTYHRADGKTKEYLKKTLNCVKEQTHQDYFVYLIGDKYTEPSDFYDCASILDHSKIAAINLPYAKERDKYAGTPAIIHNTGGTHARNIGIELSLLSGFEYIVNLDHDDLWEPDHLEKINEVITNYPNSVFICTLATYPAAETILPKIRKTGTIQPIRPIPCGIIHSSTCVNFKKIPLRYKNSVEAYGTIDPSDALLWKDMAAYMDLHNMEGYLYNKLTCYHDAEGEAFK